VTDIIETPSEDVIVIEQNAPIIITTPDPSIIVQDQPDTILHETETTVVIETGLQGPPGPEGPTGPQGPAGGEDVALAKQIDWIDDDHVYIGDANPGSATSAASWRIKYTVFQADGDAAITWADGDDNFDNIWDNRLTYSYS